MHPHFQAVGAFQLQMEAITPRHTSIFPSSWNSMAGWGSSFSLSSLQTSSVFMLFIYYLYYLYTFSPVHLPFLAEVQGA